MTITVLESDAARERWPEFVALAVRAKSSWGYSRSFMERFETFIAEEIDDLGHLVVVTCHDGADLIGFATIDVSGTGAWLEDLWVEPDRQGEGFGRELLVTCMDLARAAECEHVRLESDPHAASFYERQGGRPVGSAQSTFEIGRMLPMFQFDLDSSIEPVPG